MIIKIESNYGKPHNIYIGEKKIENALCNKKDMVDLITKVSECALELELIARDKFEIERRYKND